MVDPTKKSHSGKQILVIGARMLTPDMDGGSLRMYHLLILLKEFGYQVTFLATFLSSWPPYTSRLPEDTKRLRELGVEVPAKPTINSVEEYLQKKGSRYQIVILSDVYVAHKHIKQVRKYAPDAVIWFDTVDLHYLRLYREAKLTRNVAQLKRALYTKKRELAVANEADCTLVVSSVEKAILEKECPNIRIHVISNIHQIDPTRCSFSEREGMLFVGSFEHPPNIDAVNYFMEEIYPLINREMKGIKCYIIGAHPPPSIKRWHSEHVFVTDYVPDLLPYFKKVRLSLAPLRSGAGVKGKVLMSMSYGVPVVASSIACEGMYLTDGKDVLIANNAQDFSHAVLRLYQSENLWHEIAQNGIRIVEEHFSFSAIGLQLLSLLNSCKRKT